MPIKITSDAKAYILSSPMEQYEIYPLFSLYISLPNTMGYLFIAGLISIIITILGTKAGKSSLIPTGFGIAHESLFRSILLMVDTYMNSVYFPLIYTVFHTILFSNLIGMIPYSSTPTVEIILTLSLAFTILIGVLIIGFLSHKVYLLSAFLPSGTPTLLIPMMIGLEVLAYMTRTFSLGLRLAINLITGHILVKVCVGFIWAAYIPNSYSLYPMYMIPMFILTLFLALELLIAYLQAYIFTFIACITFKDMT